MPNTFHSIIFGGLSASLTCNFTHPIELIKTRMQITNKPFMQNFTSLINNEGPLALWRGVRVAWAREIVYSSIKIGGYKPIRDLICTDRTPSFLNKFAAGAICGSVGCVFGNPFDVLKIKIQASKSAVSVKDILKTEYKQKGFRMLHRGLGINIMRATVLNGTKMSTYDASKGILETRFGWSREGTANIFASAFISGFCIACFITPFDVLRTRIMNNNSAVSFKTLKNGVPSILYRGFFPLWFRAVPNSILQMFFYENLMMISGNGVI
jgi:hypothetical protein